LHSFFRRRSIRIGSGTSSALSLRERRNISMGECVMTGVFSKEDPQRSVANNPESRAPFSPLHTYIPRVVRLVIRFLPERFLFISINPWSFNSQRHWQEAV
jgi:hypothetical protein